MYFLIDGYGPLLVVILATFGIGLLTLSLLEEGVKRGKRPMTLSEFLYALHGVFRRRP